MFRNILEELFPHQSLAGGIGSSAEARDFEIKTLLISEPLGKNKKNYQKKPQWSFSAEMHTK